MTKRFASMLTLAVLVLAPAAHAAENFNVSRSNKDKGLAKPGKGAAAAATVKKSLTKAKAAKAVKKVKAFKASKSAAAAKAPDFNGSRSNKDKGLAKPASRGAAGAGKQMMQE